MALLATQFFVWGFIATTNNTLLPHLRSVFELSYTQTTLIGSVRFIAYAVVLGPLAFLIERIGYKRAIIVGLLVMAVGAVGMVPAASIPSNDVAVQGGIADRIGLQNSFWLTVACELYVLWYALWGSKPNVVPTSG